MKQTSYLSVPFVMLITLLFSSCAYSNRPLSDPDHPTFDHRLKGLWAAAGEEWEAVYLHIGVDENGRAQIHFIEHDHNGTLDAMSFAMHSTHIDGNWYGNLLELDDSGCAAPMETRRYLFVKYQITDAGDLAVSIIDSQSIAEAIDSGELRGVRRPIKTASKDKAEAGETILRVGHYVEITDTPGNILQFIRSRDPETLFDKLLTFKKIGP